jgi:transposase
LQEHGIEGSRAMSEGGRPAGLSGEQLDELRELQLTGLIPNGYGTDLWTLKRVRMLIEKQYGITYSDVHVWRLLGALGFSSQKPEKRAIEHNEAAVAQCPRRLSCPLSQMRGINQSIPREPLTWTPPVCQVIFRKKIDCSLTSGLLREFILLASMVFADGALSEQRGFYPQEVPRV